MPKPYRSKLNWVSHHILEPKILKWFEKHGGNPIFQWNQDELNRIPLEQPVDLVLIGKPLWQLSRIAVSKFAKRKIRVWRIQSVFKSFAGSPICYFIDCRG